MLDLSCFLSGMLALCSAPVLTVLWHRRTGARFYPALIALGACLPVFFIGNVIRSCFSTENALAFYVQNALLFGILEEGTKYLVLRFYLTNYDSYADAVTYSFGHGAYEAFGQALRCFGLIGTGQAASDIFWVNLFGTVEGAAYGVAVAVLIAYAIRTENAKIVMPAVILLHAAENFIGSAIGMMPFTMLIRTLLTAGACFAAYRLWRAAHE